MTLCDIYEVNIETLNTCTRRCPYCKFGIHREWTKKIMDEEVFEKILYDLKKVNYDSLIGPFVNNEPLMDKRMESFIRKISSILPAAKSYLFSNGDLLNKSLLQRLFNAGLHKMCISVYTDERFGEFLEYVKYFGDKKLFLNKVFETDRKSFFHNRGGSIKSDIVNQNKYFEHGCCLPFRQLVINPEGDVYLCCCDFYYEVIFDNVKERSLIDIFFNNQRLKAIRDQLAQNNRKGLFLCEQCSFSGDVPPLTL